MPQTRKAHFDRSIAVVRGIGLTGSLRPGGNGWIDRLCAVHAAQLINMLLRKLKSMPLVTSVTHLELLLVLYKLRRIGHMLSRGELLLWWQRWPIESREVPIALPHSHYRIMQRLPSWGKPITGPRLLWRV